MDLTRQIMTLVSSKRFWTLANKRRQLLMFPNPPINSLHYEHSIFTCYNTSTGMLVIMVIAHLGYQGHRRSTLWLPGRFPCIQVDTLVVNCFSVPFCFFSFSLCCHVNWSQCIWNSKKIQCSENKIDLISCSGISSLTSCVCKNYYTSVGIYWNTKWETRVFQ